MEVSSIRRKSDPKGSQVDTSKVVPSTGSQFALDPTQTGASNPAVFKAAQEAREKRGQRDFLLKKLKKSCRGIYCSKEGSNSENI